MLNNFVLPVITGIISGIISSIIVTQSYRIKDRERDRVKYFEELYAFYLELNEQLWGVADPDNIEELNTISMPKLYKWIYVNDKEMETIKKLDEIYCEVVNIVRKISIEITELRMENPSEKDQDGVIGIERLRICQKYIECLKQCREELDKIHDEVYCLEHPEERKLIDEIKDIVENS